MKTQIVIYILLLASFFPVHWVVAQEIEIIKDIVYREGHERWKLDLMRTVGNTEELRPGIVFIHGGGFKHGDKKNLHGRMKIFAQRGFVCITVNYRLSGEVSFPAPLEDVKCAIRWFRANAGTYNVDPGRIGGWGNSAGSLLVAMLGLTEHKFEGDGPYQEFSSRLQAVVPIGFLADLSIGRMTVTRKAFIGGPSEALGERMRLASPISYVNKDAPPFLIIHGTVDTVLDVSHSTSFAKALEDAGAPHVDLFLIEGGSHALHRDFQATLEPKMLGFFEKFLLPED